MSNEYYDHTTYPGPNAPGSSAALRAELDSIEQGFDKMPTLAGNAGKVAAVNGAGDALVATNTLAGLTLNSTSIGTTTPAAGAFTNLSATGTASLGSAVTIAGGSINNTPIGTTTPSSGSFTTLAASSGYTGNVTGNVTGNLTGNVTAGSGTSTFNNVTVNGALDMASATVGTISGLLDPSSSSDATNKGYVDTRDALKLSLTGGTMSGELAMGANKITGLGAPSAGTDAATKTYVDTQDALKLSLSGGTMSGAIAMGNNSITGLPTPSASSHAATKGYVDTIMGSTTSAAESALAAANSASAAANSATSAQTFASNAQTSANDAAATYDAFDDRYLGAKAADPTVDNDGNALLTGALYWNTGSSIMKVWTGSAWSATYLPATGYLALSGGTMTGNITFAGGQTWPTFNQSTTGNAATATALQTARTINGVSFNGTANITVTANTPNSLTINGTPFNGSSAVSLTAGDVFTTSAQTLTNKTIRLMTSVVSTNTAAVASTTYVLTASLTLTLPATPTAGDWVRVVNRSATTTAVVARNGEKIMGLSEDMTLNDVNAKVLLVYADATQGWVIANE